MSSNIPITVSIDSKYSGIWIGSKHIKPPANSPSQGFWYYGIDLKEPAGPAVFDVTSKSNTDVPSEVVAHENDPLVLLCFTFLNLPARSIPQNPLTAFLRAAGSGAELAKTEQMVEQTGSGIFGFPNYGLVATMDTRDQPGFETVDYFNSGYLAFQLMPVECNGQTTYAPVQIT